MKKLTAFIISILLMFGLAACGSGDSKVPATEPTSDTANATAATANSSNTDSTAPTNAKSGKTLVVYYSATGNTEDAARYIAAATDGDTFELVPKDDYTDEDLNYTDSDSRVVYEHDHPEARDIELVKNTVDDWAEYDTVFIGYPIWWQIAAWPVDNFIKANDFSGKTVIPFCTSASSGLGDSGKLLQDMAKSGNWLEGQRFSSGVSEQDVKEWIDGLNLGK